MHITIIVNQKLILNPFPFQRISELNTVGVVGYLVGEIELGNSFF